MPTFYRLLLVLLTSVAIAGCGASKALKPEDLAAIRSVSVDKSVRITNRPFIIGSEASLGVLFGVAGAATAATMQQSAAEKFTSFLKDSGIDVGEIVREQFTQRLKRDPRFGKLVADDGRDRFLLEVPVFGITKTNALSSYWVAMLRVNYQLKTADGRLVAEDWAAPTPFSEQTKFTMEEIRANPKILRKAFAEQAAAVVAKLL
ncbi:hypothetical protein [Candidatus Thiodictyon syntrophicum]|uniref:ABC-type transport auxiliary lipoprotein component domain-containing protein n=1 Tax=Candidatus Thiodictyon syntrophicum TaxID=1166950 RepID=A0A2K8U399_9GAMM|nr:hypothetical protein [Candidatus Thiodictyon syntrophicum]AUB80062.1 hypothetical protein THSYN_03170 [Candidatus Thiodictyon syntrophicum]